MTIKEVYIAFDGKEFDDELECKEYEYRKQLDKFAGVHVFDKCFDVVALCDETGLQTCSYCSIDEDDTAEEFASFCYNIYGILMPDKKGRWYYDDKADHWRNADKEAATLVCMLQNIANAIQN